jgi:tyrosyl-tRNA synthetase
MQVDLWLLGMDQHGANMLAREYCNLMQSKNTPIALFHCIFMFRIIYCVT